MKKGDPITIIRSANGFIVDEARSQGDILSLEKLFVFPSIMCLSNWIEDHFGNEEEVDAP